MGGGFEGGEFRLEARGGGIHAGGDLAGETLDEFVGGGGEPVVEFAERGGLCGPDVAGGGAAGFAQRAGGRGEGVLGGGEIFLRGGLELRPLGGGLGNFLRGGFEPLALAGPEGDEFLFQFLFLGVGGGGELRLELGDLVLQLVREVLGVAEIFLREFGDLVEAGGGDADLLGGGTDGDGERFEGGLALVERRVFLAFVAGDERHEQHGRAGEHARGDRDHRGGVHRIGSAVGDHGGGGDEHDVGRDEDPRGQFGSGVGGHHEEAAARARLRRGGGAAGGRWKVSAARRSAAQGESGPGWGTQSREEKSFQRAAVCYRWGR